MQLTERDIEIIKFINEFGFCELDQLGKRFALKRSWMYEIMKKLVDAGLVHHKHILNSRHGIYLASRKGAEYTDLPPIDRITVGQYEHNISIIKVYIKLRQLYPDAFWISERRLKQDKFYDGVGKVGHISDGILLFPDEKRVAIEVEMSVKGKHRIEKILRELGSDFSIKEVWYFCSKHVIKAVTSSASGMQFVKVLSLEEFLL
ncbi:MAG: MarR family winged helix-turn-helix transcriptional regulator [Gammaproteobacteria bacterium]|nr:MarR family winged helix-turn-helix transcriptional regulator [Gammaproteobacteria bacterium]